MTSANRVDRDALPIIFDSCYSGAWIDEHTKMGKNYYDAEPNGTVKHGKFMKVKKK